MELAIHAFGISRDILGASMIKIESPTSITVAELRKTLFDRYPDLAALKSLAIAVNEEYADDDQLVKLNDEIVLIPPVSGG